MFRDNGLTVDHIIPLSEAPKLAYGELKLRVPCRTHNAERGGRCTAAEREQVLTAIKARTHTDWHTPPRVPLTYCEAAPPANSNSRYCTT